MELFLRVNANLLKVFVKEHLVILSQCNLLQIDIMTFDLQGQGGQIYKIQPLPTTFLKYGV